MSGGLSLPAPAALWNCDPGGAADADGVAQGHAGARPSGCDLKQNTDVKTGYTVGQGCSSGGRLTALSFTMGGTDIKQRHHSSVNQEEDFDLCK